MSVEGAGARGGSIASFPSNVGPQGVPACWDAGEVRPPCVALLANPAARADGEVFDSNYYLQGVGERACQGISGTAVGTRSSTRLGHADAGAGKSGQPTRPPQLPSADAALQLVMQLFFGVAGGLVATGGHPGVTGVKGASLEALSIALEAQQSMWTRLGRAADAKALFAPERLDQEEALAYIINDLLGRPLLDKAHARLVGRQVNSGLKADAVVVKRCYNRTRNQVRAAKHAAIIKPELLPGIADAQAAGDLAQAKEREHEWNLMFPPAVVAGAKRKEPEQQQVEERSLTELEGDVDEAWWHYMRAERLRRSAGVAAACATDVRRRLGCRRLGSQQQELYPSALADRFERAADRIDYLFYQCEADEIMAAEECAAHAQLAADAFADK